MNKEKYLNSKGENCLFCNSGDITASSEPEIGIKKIYIEMGCYSCGKYWTDTYTLSDTGK